MTDAPNGWPDPARPGVPLHPERDGAHWIVRDGRIVPARWTAGNEAWRPADKCTPFAGYSAHGPTVARWRYLGPCLTPAEVAAALAAQAMATQEQIAQVFADNEMTATADEIRALPLPSTSALDAMLAEAKREGMREAAAYLAARAKALRLRDAEDRGIPDHMGHSFEANAGDAWAAAILAAAQEPAP
jgi:hypothetical protein